MSDDDLVLPGTADGPYMYLKCPILGELRNSMLCETICADHAWARPKKNKIRSQCESYAMFMQIKKELRDGED